MRLAGPGHRAGLLLGALALLALASAPHGAAAAEPASDWVQGHQSRVRLVAGKASSETPDAAPVAGIEIEMADGWKTYWRNPGDAGGVPPAFDWADSENVTPVVLYPAPHRLVDAAGETIGYKNRVTFPVRLAFADAAKPAKLRLKLEYGVCREICIPAEATLALDVPRDLATAMPSPLAAAWTRVPRAAGTPGVPSPSIVSSKTMLDGDKPRIEFVAAFPVSEQSADAFVEGPGGAYVPMPKKVSVAGKNVTYALDLAGIDLADIKGKDLTVTLVSDGSLAEVTLPVK